MRYAALIVAVAFAPPWIVGSQAAEDDSPKPSRYRTAEAAILEALAEPTDVDFVDTPLTDVVDFLARQHGIQVLLDHRALEREAVDTQTAVTCQVGGISLRSALALILRDFHLSWMIDGEVLLITSRQEADEPQDTRVYDVADLVVDENWPEGTEDFDSLLSLITSAIAPESWPDGNASHFFPATISTARVLVIPQTREVHEMIEKLLRDIRAAGGEESGAACIGVTPIEAKFRAALDEETSLDFVDTPLIDAVEFLRSRHGIEIQLDRTALSAIGVDANTPITIHVRNVSLRSALRHMLRDLELTWTIQHEVLMITSEEEADLSMTILVYPVADLALARDQFGQLGHDYGDLHNVIVNQLKPSWWDSAGGPASFCAGTFGKANVLVVRQSWQMHDRVAELLAELRRVAAQHEGPPPLKPRFVPGAPDWDPFGMGGMGGMGGFSAPGGFGGGNGGADTDQDNSGPGSGRNIGDGFM